MKTLPSYLKTEKNAVNSKYPFVLLFKVVFNTTPETTIYLARSNENITFDGHEFIAFPIEIKSRKDSAKGSIPTVEIQVSNVSRIVESHLENLSGAVASKVTIYVVNTAYLATPSDYAELTVTYDIIQTKADPKWVSFTLGAPYITRQRFPLHMYLGDFCLWLPNYAIEGMECNYGYVVGKNLGGTLPTCTGTLKDCLNHNNEENFGGHVGLIEVNFRLV